MYGAGLIEALRRRVPSLEFFGAGGNRMRAAGCDTIVDTKDLAVVGITEIISHLPRILGCYRRLIAEADKRRPDLAIVIDSPAFNWRLARQMRRLGVPVIYYVCPQFWAWRQGRVRLLRDYVNQALVIFPFEEKFYRDRGVDAVFVGHPLAQLRPPIITRTEFALRHQLDPARTWITLMPGSRRKEVLRNLPPMVDAARQLGHEFEFVLPIASTLEPGWMERQISQHIGQSGVHVAVNRDAYGSLHHSRAGIVASGTATVEAAMIGTPFVMVYRVTPLTYLLGKHTVKVPYFAMVNLIVGEGIVPELVQNNYTAENVIGHVRQLLPDGPVRDKMLQGFTQVKTALRGPAIDGQPPAERAADLVLQLLKPKDLRYP